jgi:hypothetical protein
LDGRLRSASTHLRPRLLPIRIARTQSVVCKLMELTI